MKITFVDEPNKTPSFVFEIGDSKVEVIASTFIATLFEKMDNEHRGVAIPDIELHASKLANLDPTILNPTARPIGVGTVRTNVTILPETKKKASLIGRGNVSFGIDIAVQKFDI